MPRPIREVVQYLYAAANVGETDGELLGRYVRDRDGEAFAVLVARHGPTVLGVCRRVVGDHHAAEDAYQAAFLVLARRAAAVSPPSAVGAWLHGVARRTALEARKLAARRKEVDGPVPEPATVPGDPLADVRPVLDEEVARLPARYRAVVVLCDLEGRTRADAARQLGVPEGTASGRLTTARRLLAARLTRRGVGLAVPAAAAGLPGAAAAVPVGLLARAAVPGGPASPPFLLLTHKVLQAMLFAKLKAGAVALALLAAVGVVVVRADAGGEKPQPATARPAVWEPTPLERKLVGSWVGGGLWARTLAFRPDGTFRESAIGAKGHDAEGTWALDADRLPATLELEVTKADGQELVGTAPRLKGVGLDTPRWSSRATTASGSSSGGPGRPSSRRGASATAASAAGCTPTGGGGSPAKARS